MSPEGPAGGTADPHDLRLGPGGELPVAWRCRPRRNREKKQKPLHWMLLTTEGQADLDTACSVPR